MKIAYLILAHNNPIHLNRMINALSSPDCIFFVHIDKKVNLDDFSGLKSSKVFFSKKRYPIYYSHFSQVKATLKLIELALKHPDTIDRFVLLSGTHYPLRSPSYVAKFFEEQPREEFIEIFSLPSDRWWQGGVSRLKKYKLTPTNADKIRHVQRKLRRHGFIPKEWDYKDYLGDLSPYGGSQWWALTREACQYIFRFKSREKRIVRYYKHTSNPEEMFIQTIIANSPFRDQVKPYLTYVDWSAKGPHPENIDERHLEIFKNNLINSKLCEGSRELLFARKFSDGSENVLIKINDFIQSNSL